MNIESLNWYNFGLKGESKQKSFEDLCMFLLSRELKVPKIEAFHNQPGIETEPFIVNGKKYGFQTKFFESGFSWEQIKKSILGKENENFDENDLKRMYPNNVFERYKLDILYVCSNKNPSISRVKEKIDKLAKLYNTKVEYWGEQTIKQKLMQPSNLDLAQIYFGVGDELGFIRNSVNPNILTFIQSKEYIDLPLENGSISANNFTEYISDSLTKIFILLGNPGSGKTILMHKLLEKLGGLDKENKEEQIKILLKNQAVPILINLKNCAFKNLEEIIRGRKNDNKVNNHRLGFIYLLDGLDELDENRTDLILNEIYELSKKSDTRKIVISCRTGSVNVSKLRNYIKEREEFKISSLDFSYIKNYFHNKANEQKIHSLYRLLDENKKFISEINDILLIKLLWDTIEELDENSTILDLFEKELDLILSNHKHKKYIENLNLPNPKEKALIEINKHLSFILQKKIQFRFNIDELQQYILEKFPRLDYKSVNQIINYIADLFFEKDYTDEYKDSYIYQHRRFQEYFFTLKLKEEYEKNPYVIRELKVIANKDYFEEMFLKYIRKIYEKESNLPGLLELNLIDVYLNKHRGFGTNEPYYLNSTEFKTALLIQKENNLNELIEDEYLKIEEKLGLNPSPNDIKEKFKNLKKANYKDTKLVKSLLDIWNKTNLNLLEAISSLWKFGKREIAEKYIHKLDKLNSIYEDDNFWEIAEKLEIEDIPFWIKEDFLYYKIVVKNKNLKNFFDKLRPVYKNLLDKSYSWEESEGEKFIKSFFRICLRDRKDELINLLYKLDQFEFINFLDVLREKEFLFIFFKDIELQEKIKNHLIRVNLNLTDRNIFLLFYKNLLNIDLTQNEKTLAEEELKKLYEKRNIDLIHYKFYENFAILSFILNKNSFENSLKNLSEFNDYYNERILYSALFIDYINMLQGNKNLKAIIRDYFRYVHHYYRDLEIYHRLSFAISELWAYIFAHSKIDIIELRTLKNVLFRILDLDESKFKPFKFYRTLIEINSKIYSKIANETDLTNFEEKIHSWDGELPELIDYYFDLAILFSPIDSKKAKNYIEKGIVEGTLRHGWRKDTIVSYMLVDALEILWRNNFLTRKKLRKYTEEVFYLTIKVSKITDSKNTWEGPYNLIEMVSKYDIDFAEELKNKLLEEGSKISNIAITSIIKGKISIGISLEDLEKYIKSYRINYNWEGKPYSEYYIEKFKVYMDIIENDLYTDEEKKLAFQKAYEQIENIKKFELSIFHPDKEFLYKYEKYKDFCLKMGKTFIKIEIEESSEEFNKTKSKYTEEEFINLVKSCTTKRQLLGKYKILDNYNNGIVLIRYESWNVLVNKTFEIFGNIKPLTNYLEKNYYPHTDFYTTNSKYMHYAIASALNNLDTKQEIIDYLSKNSGYEGFLNVMKAYEVLENKEMCIKLFEKYLRFCKFLVY